MATNLTFHKSKPSNPIDGDCYIDNMTGDLFIFDNNGNNWLNATVNSTVTIVDYAVRLENLNQFIREFCVILQNYIVLEFKYIENLLCISNLGNSEDCYNYLENEFTIFKNTLVREELLTREQISEIENSILILNKLGE